MDFVRLRYFIELAECLHFGRAAEALGMTQPPLSRQIRLLEEELGVVLFHRTQRSVELSAAGLWLVPEARRLLEDAFELKARIAHVADGQSGELTLGFVSIADYALLPELLRDFRAAFPHVRLNLQEATSDVQLEMLAARRIDAGLLIPPVPLEAGDVHYVALIEERLIAALPRALARRLRGTRVAIGLLAKEPLIMFPRRVAPGFYDAIIDLFGDAGFAPRIVQEAIQMQTIVGLVAGELGVALVPESIAKLRRPGVVYRDIEGATRTVEVGIAWQATSRSPVLAAFVSWLSGWSTRRHTALAGTDGAVSRDSIRGN